MLQTISQRPFHHLTMSLLQTQYHNVNII